MKKKILLIVLVVAFALVIGGASGLYNKLSQDQAPDQLATQSPTQAQEISAPDFTVYDLEGKAVKLSDYFGKPIVLNFWASWCGPCQSEMPDFQEKFLEVGEEITFLMVNMTDGSRETVDIASRFIRDKGYTFPVLYDTENSAAIAYAVYSLPTTYFIDRQGKLVANASGALDKETLQKGIDLIK